MVTESPCRLGGKICQLSGWAIFMRAEIGRDRAVDWVERSAARRTVAPAVGVAAGSGRPHYSTAGRFEHRSVLLVQRGPLTGSCALGDLLAGIGFDAHRMLTHLVEGGVAGHVRLWGPRRDFFLDGRLAVAGIGVVAEELRWRRSLWAPSFWKKSASALGLYPAL